MSTSNHYDGKSLVREIKVKGHIIQFQGLILHIRMEMYKNLQKHFENYVMNLYQVK